MADQEHEPRERTFRDRVRNSTYFRDPLVLPALGAVSGILTAEYVELAPRIFLAIFLCTAIAAIFKGHRIFGIGFLILFAAFGFQHRLSLEYQQSFPGLDRLKKGGAVTSEFEGVIRSDPQRYENSERTRFLLVTDEGSYRLPVTVLDPKKTLRYGDRIMVRGNLELISEARNPGAFSPRKFYQRDPGTLVKLDGGYLDAFEVLNRDRGNFVVAFGLRSREWLSACITRGISDDDAKAVVKAMVLGLREEASRDLIDQFRLSGSMHLFAVSGLHVGVFSLIIWWLLRWMGLRIEIAVTIVILLVLFYAVITGMRPSAIRAAIMVSIFFAGLGAMRRAYLLNSLALAALLILGWNTHQLFMPGAQLSFFVLLAIAMGVPSFNRWLNLMFPPEDLIPRALKSRTRRFCEMVQKKALLGLATSLAALIGSAPLVIYHFHSIAPISLVSNLIMIPLAFGIIVLGTLSSLLSVIQLAPLATLLNWLNGWLAIFSVYTASLFSQVPLGFIHVAPSSDRGVAADVCRITVLDTGDGGSANLIEIGTVTVLVDCGDEDAFRWTVEPLMRYRGKGRINHLLLSHGDSNHIGSAAKVIERFPVDCLWEADPGSRARVTRPLEEAVENLGVSSNILTVGDEISLGPSSFLKVLYPHSEASRLPMADDRALAILLVHHDWKCVFLGDAGTHTESWLRDQGTDLDADILIRGWNSQTHSAATDLTKRITPDVAIATNHHFPMSEIIPDHFLEDMRTSGASLFDQAETGAVIVDLAPEEAVVRSYLTDQERRLSRIR